ncbi:MAG: phytoene desaturase family protein, partial [Bdellovibrionota bacterium]
QILVENAKVVGVRLKSGETLRSDLVVSNADVVHTYEKLLRGVDAAKSQTKRVKAMRPSMSLFLIYFGTNKKYPDLAHHNVIFGPRYKGLLADIFDNGTLPDDFSLYLHAPTKSDPSLAPEGHEGFYVLSPVGHLGKLKVDWKTEGPRYAEKIMAYLEERYLPGLKESLVTQRIFTPDDFASELNAHLGSAFSSEPLLTQSAFFRTHNRDASIEGLYFAGAGTHPGAGVPGVVNSAKATAKLVQEDFGTQADLASYVAGFQQHA